MESRRIEQIRLLPRKEQEFVIRFLDTARDEATRASDVDLLVEFDGRPVGLFHLSRTQHYPESILGTQKVDFGLRDGIKPALREHILRDAIYGRLETGLSGSRTSSTRLRRSGVTFPMWISRRLRTMKKSWMP